MASDDNLECLPHQVLSSRGLLGRATRVLVTHQTQYLAHADHIVLMDTGNVVAQGGYETLDGPPDRPPDRPHARPPARPTPIGIDWH